MSDDLIRLRARHSHEQELSRRQFLQLVAASTALGLAEGCQPNPPEQILPYVRQPLELLPGETTHYATSFLIDGYATGLLVATREGRPLKVEGNPRHPATLGGTSAFQQAAVWSLYDPDRAQSVLQRGQPSTWDALDLQLSAAREDQGERLRILLEPSSSPLLQAQLAAVKRRFARSKVTFYTPIRARMPEGASERLFGSALDPVYALDRARVIVSLDSDFLSCPYALGYARDFAKNRHVDGPDGQPNRLYAVEAALSVTGSAADHRLRKPAGRVAAILAALSGELGGPRAAGLRLDEQEQRFVSALARDLRAQPPGSTLLIAGERQPAEVHVLSHALNAQLGNVGQSVRFIQPVLPSGDQTLSELVQELRAGAVDTLLMVGVNPVYDAPPELDFSRALARVPQSIYAGMYCNETAAESTWLAPLSHPFESWGDGRAYDGTLSFVQPLIRPQYATRTATELLAVLAAQPLVGDRARLRVAFGERSNEGLNLHMSAAERSQHARVDVTQAFEQALAQGLIEDTAYAPVDVRVDTSAVTQALRLAAAQPTAANGPLELNFLRSPTLHDGRFANIAWLLELPEPTTKLTWDNAALMSPKTARDLGIPDALPRDDDEYPVVELTRAGRSVRVPVLCSPDHADDSVSIWLGYGRRGAERLARGVGVNAYPLRTHENDAFVNDLRVHPRDERYPLALTQIHTNMRDRPIALRTSLSDYRKKPDFTAQYKDALPSLMDHIQLPGPQWAMSIDLGLCTGCSACVIACQAENNVPVVGKEQVRHGRVMHWLRIDNYYTEAMPERVIHQPMMCQHCEKAPCEYVCPVNATEHSPDGLNEMVYNRCVGTRFCSNNCPYKVRRFNWFNWESHEPANQGRIQLQRNPEVTVRQRGVMEKCTYCVQRIRRADITARNEKREIRAGEVVTACQQACPTGAIQFDSLTHPETPMHRWRALPHSYAVLHETGATPRTHYLARIDNPNPELAT